MPNNTTTITLYREKAISWNSLYSGKHWTYRSKEANRVHLLVREQIDPSIPPYDVPVNIRVTAYRKTLRRFDPDNICAKLYIDGLVPLVIADDDYTHVSSVTTAVRVGSSNPRVVIEVSPA